MTIVQSIKKIRSYLKIIIDKYFLIDQNRALLEPAVYDENIINRYQNNDAKSGLEAIRFSLYVGAISDIKALLFDTGKKTASLSTLCKLLSNENIANELCKDICNNLPKDRRLYGDMDELTQEIAERSLNEHKVNYIREQFNIKLPNVLQQFDELKSSELAKRIIDARDKAIAHYEVKKIGNDRSIHKIQDYSLKWSDLSGILSHSKLLIIELCYLVNLNSYDFESGIRINNRISSGFWNI
jgi:hypothetical protein